MRTPQSEEEHSLFEYVRFTIDAEEEALERERAKVGWVGHPPWLMWFCAEHLPLGREMEHLHWREVLERLRAQR